MKKLSSLALAGVLALVGVSQASAIPVKLTVDDASRVECKVNYEPFTIHNGVNEFNVDDYIPVSLTSTTGNIICSVKNAAGTLETSWTNTWTIYPNSYGSSYDFVITTGNIQELRTGTATLTVDDASKVSAQYTGTFLTLDGLQNGSNTIHFIPDVEKSLYIDSKTYGVPLYRVTLNGENIQKGDYNYTVPLSQGAQIGVLTEFPDEQEAVSFQFLNDGAEFITQVLVDGVEVTNYLDPGFTVKCGSKLTIKGNTNDFRFNKIECNGSTSTYFYSEWSTYIVAPSTITIDVTRYPTYTFTLNVDDPARVIVYRGSQYYNDIVNGLVAGDNTLQIKSSDPTLTVKPQNGYFISSVTLNGEEQTQYSGSYYFSVTDGATVNIVSGEIVRDDRLSVFVNDASIPTSMFSFARADRSALTLETGYNIVKFNANDVPFQLSAYGQNTMEVYLNNVLVSPFYSGGSSYELSNIANNDCLKIFFNETPQLYNVTFTAGANVGNVAATYDRVRSFTLADQLQAFPGTEFSIVPQDGQQLAVRVNSVAVTPVDGAYVFTLGAENTQVDVTLENTGVAEIGIEENATVYNMQGIAVMRNASVKDIENLPAGIYIINGKKIRK